jgi:hypothetical protein
VREPAVQERSMTREHRRVPKPEIFRNSSNFY